MNKKTKLFSIITLTILILTIITNFAFAANEDVTLEKVQDNVCKIELNQDGEVTKKLVSVDNPKKEIIIQVDAKNLKSQEEIVEPSEIFLVIDNSDSMVKNTLASGITRKEAVFTAAKTLATQLLQAQSNTKIGVVSFSTNSDTSKEGTIEDANLVIMPTNQITDITTAIDTIQATGVRTNIDAGLQVAKNNFTQATDLNQYLILLTDGVPNTAVGGPTMTYSGEVTTKTKATLQSVLDKNINIITVMTGVNSTYQPDADGSLSADAAGKTYLDLAEEIFGTAQAPNYGKFYYVTDENVEKTITENVFSDVVNIKENELNDIVIIDYLPDNIVANYDFSIAEEPNIGEVSRTIDETNNSFTWTIGKLAVGQTATFKYKLTLKENFDEKILNVETPTNTKLDVTYKDTEGKAQTKTSNVSPSVILKKDNTIAPDPMPQTGDNAFYISFAILALVAILGIYVAKYKKDNK